VIMPQESLIVEPIPALSDNYIWMFSTGEKQYAAVDPGEGEPVIRWLNKQGATLSHILLTHHHGDHIGGAQLLKEKYHCQIIGSLSDSSRLPQLDQGVGEGDRIEVGSQWVEVMETPGHTIGHVVYLVKDALFAGDTLFSLGCGRLFEGSAEMMWQSLKKIQALPDKTQLYAAHEYTLTNHGFALTLEPENRDLLEIQPDLMEKNDRQQPTLPTSLGFEKKFNPFLRCKESALATQLGLEKNQPVERFAWIRSKRNQY
jgi:hydroxyacylglutathione hydrolase